MGLDMYLTAQKFLGFEGYSYCLNVVVTDANGNEVKLPSRPTYLTCEIGYWRKANAIHKWFVDNVQDGEDRCQLSYVSREQLRDLLLLVDRVLESSKLIDGKVRVGQEMSYERYGDREFHDVMKDGQKLESISVAVECLPTSDGFFFGNQDYNEYYWGDLVDTKKFLEAALSLDGSWTFYYRASW